ncbi:23128_t:CDS:2 [Cetraspora pellucida]|uniref:23128_t:CDS:1 n=1 Tax=Cetraspora pellucida TaxID=1433469 RepID=A0A9N8VPL2_9GLOM|nr:23128_t:CDS:2 [Cetraspora pellucida]
MPGEGKVKTYYFSVNKYIEWIKDLEKSGLSYCHHDHRSVAGKSSNKKSHLVQKDSKKCKCISYIFVVLLVKSLTVTLKYYYKHRNHRPSQLSDLCTLQLSDNIRQFIQQHALEGLDVFSIHKLIRFRAIELQDQLFIKAKKPAKHSNSFILIDIL